MRPQGFRQVDRSLRMVDRQIRSAVRGLNQQAAKLTAKGKYEEARSVVAFAQSALRYRDLFESVVAEWYEASGRQAGGAKTTVPLWRCYVVIARTLKALGGDATLKEVIANVGATVSGDTALQTSLGAVLTAAEWKRAIERSRNPMKQHGYIEAIAPGRWKLTQLGVDLANQDKGP